MIAERASQDYGTLFSAVYSLAVLAYNDTCLLEIFRIFAVHPGGVMPVNLHSDTVFAGNDRSKDE